MDPPLLSGGEMDQPYVLRLSRRRYQEATIRTAQKILQTYKRVDIRAMGAAITYAIEVSNALVQNSLTDLLQTHVRTYSIPMNGSLPTGHISDHNGASSTASVALTSTSIAKKKPNDSLMKYGSGISIIVYSGDL
tara:strand:- start:67 stop:471 length:405 start_codon:yes stop_codon:yes gene_type:complete